MERDYLQGPGVTGQGGMAAKGQSCFTRLEVQKRFQAEGVPCMGCLKGKQINRGEVQFQGCI